jgi:hypothetical protein
MSVEWERDASGLSVADIERRQPYKMDPHNLKRMKRFPWLVCAKCGLVSLRNSITEWSIRFGCNASDHPGYRAALAKSSRPS